MEQYIELEICLQRWSNNFEGCQEKTRNSVHQMVLDYQYGVDGVFYFTLCTEILKKSVLDESVINVKTKSFVLEDNKSNVFEDKEKISL